ncbi:MAG: phosphoribosylformylglycinamidine synthase [Vallitaleaceae bacterium]|nr:phosphoribosylformylglycinamidine synthase [Vallitaleaceae bacterium]
MIRRVYVEKKAGCNIKSQQLLSDLKEHLNIEHLDDLRILQRYDVDHISDQAYKEALHTIFSEPQVDVIYEEQVSLKPNEIIFGIEYLPGQYDQRADSCEQAINILSSKEKATVKAALMITLTGNMTLSEVAKIKRYIINPVDSRESSLEKPTTLEIIHDIPQDVKVIDGFIGLDEQAVELLWKELRLAMTIKDLKHTQQYFKEVEKRNPTITEIRVLDTYWSDHCRHTTFLTAIKDVTIEEGKYNKPVKATYQQYLEDREVVYGHRLDEKDICLMDMALMAMKKMRKEGKLLDLEVSDEINACSIIVPVDVGGSEEEWLVMFKNETHNHPTEIEPFGGAATCLGGAIRDPLSGRSYVYQAMRVTGAADPTVPIEETLPGKLSQRKIVTDSAHGYSSYGNQIGLATGKVQEIYHPNYVAKRLEIGAVIAATPRKHVRRETSDPGDIIVLLGGQTGRDGCGGATGSSKEHTTDSIETCGAEVQKGNPPTERKIQRLFRDEKVATLIKKCNDFGAGGVSVAIGELADGLIIDLDQVPKKYAGLDGTELAISESQERMAVVLDPKDVAQFIAYADAENLEAQVVAVVTLEKRLIMKWRNQEIVNVDRGFLDTNGANVDTDVEVKSPNEKSYFTERNEIVIDDIKSKWLENLADLNVCSPKGLVAMFDSSIGAGSVLMPYGGKHQLSPTEAMVAKIPLEKGDTTTGTIMSHGFNPYLSSWSPYHGAVYSIIDSVAKVVATGGDYSKIRFTFQEYFKRLNDEPSRWGQPFSALLGAYYAQDQLGLPSIGGKDSMSGTFHDIDVPPTLVSFAVDVVDIRDVISPEFKGAGHDVVMVPLLRDDSELPDFKRLKKNYAAIHQLIKDKKIISAHTVNYGGIAEAVSKMTFGNFIGIVIKDRLDEKMLFQPEYGGLVLELEADVDVDGAFKGIEYDLIGKTALKPIIGYRDMLLSVGTALKAWKGTLEDVFNTKVDKTEFTEDLGTDVVSVIEQTYAANQVYVCKNRIAKPTVFMPTFPGTNCEYDSKKAFEMAGASVDIEIFRNLNPSHIEESINAFVKHINKSQIIMFPGGFSAGDEPEGSGKFIATIFRNKQIREAVRKLLNERDGLILGICNGFQALVKLGLVPYGDIVEAASDAPTLTYNTIGRHISCMVDTKIISNKSPWLQRVSVGDIHTIPVSHGEGRFMIDEKTAKHLYENGQVATAYVNPSKITTMDIRYNPNGSTYAIEGITSPDGRVFGKMGHSERIGKNVAKNIIGQQDQQIFKSGVNYWR